jgi:hypothetical protein
MRRRSSSHSPISLFAFVDTLVCTMGSLILMLLAMTPKIRERAEARELARLAALAPAVEPAPEPEVAAPVAPPPAVVDEPERSAERQKRRDAWLASLADARDRLEKEQAGHHRQRELLKEAGSQLKDLHDQIGRARVKEEAAADARQSLSERETKLQEHQAKIAQKIALTRKNIDVLNRQQSEKANEYALVPYDGTSGTVRRPIYLECSKKGFRFLPEEETVSPVDLQGFSESYNPLLTGAQVLLRYWSHQARESGTRGPTPYVLMLIRPSGVERYYEARGMLAGLGANFGYELIEEDWTLSIPKADPGAKAVLKETLDKTVQMQSAVRDAFADAAQRGGFGKNGSSGGGGWGDDSISGDDEEGFGGAPGGAGPRGNRRPSIQYGPATRRARDMGEPATAGEPGGDFPGNAGTAPPSGRRPGSGTGTGTDASGSKSGPARGTGGKSVASRPAGIGGGATPGTTGAQGSDGAGSAGDATRADSGIGTDARGAPRGAGRGSTGGSVGTPGENDSGADAISEPGDGSTDGAVVGKQGTSRGGGGASTGSRAGRTPRPATLGGTPSAIDAGGESDDPDAPLQFAPEYVPRRLPGAGGSGSGGGMDDGDEPFPLKPLPQETGGGKRSSGSGSGEPETFPSRESPTPGSKSRSGSAGSPASSATDGDPSAADDSGAAGPSLPFTSSGSSSPGSPPGGQLPMGGPGVNVSLGSKGQRTSSDKADPDDGPRLSEEDSHKNGPRGRSMGPRLWGRARPRATIGLERKLEIRIMDDRILVGSKDIVIPVGNGETVEEMIHFVVAGIDRAADKWGDPPTSFYWLPTVRFVVYPGGNQYYERLHEPLEKKWGVVSTVEYAPDKSARKANGKAAKNAGGTAAGGRP